MNYLVLNDNEFFNKISLSNFKEVLLDDRNRIDGLFGSITEEILEHSDKDNRGRDIFFREQWLCRNSGILFMVFRLPKNLLYNREGEYIERCLGFFSPKDFYAEVGAIKLENKENTFEYFLILYNKKMNFNLIFDEDFIEKKEEEIIPYICKKIEEKIL